MSQKNYKLLRQQAEKHGVPYKIVKKFYKSLSRDRQILLLTKTFQSSSVDSV